MQMSVVCVCHELLNNSYFIILSFKIRLGLLVLILKIKANKNVLPVGGFCNKLVATET